ncbi:MAG TPA: hypothetical protein VFZ09_23765 [Archangium sp.]|uniref:hypothetical protein n=1 Tax=Archangium sp. TaxID=1872627 RepID=UPI002E30A863|nr:hypothetical protein [Archangium sp.]HEX5749267.1 hypothetical protein [Archangium sp.]
MPRRIPTRPLVLLLVSLGSAAGGAYAYHRYRDAGWERRYDEYQRQLQGKLTESEKQMQALNTELGTARARLVTQASLDEKYQALLTAKDADFEKFRREHALAVKSLSDATFQLQQREHGGTETAREEPPPTPSPAEPTAPSAHPVISYEFKDAEGRVQLKDPNIWVQGDEELQLQQLFRVEGTVLQQTNGSLMTERVQLQEVSADGAGKYRELAAARLVDASFTYANAPLEGPPGGPKWGPSWMATVGTSFRSESLLRVGASARVVKWGPVGLAGGLSSDFLSLEGSGGALHEPPDVDDELLRPPLLRGPPALARPVHEPRDGAQAATGLEALALLAVLGDGLGAGHPRSGGPELLQWQRRGPDGPLRGLGGLRRGRPEPIIHSGTTRLGCPAPRESARAYSRP